MKQYLIFAILLKSVTSSLFAFGGTFKLATYNINYSRTAVNEWTWLERKERVEKLIKEINADVIALQEVVKSSPNLDDAELSYADVRRLLEAQGYQVFEAPFRTDRKGVEQYLLTGVKKERIAKETLIPSVAYHLNDLVLGEHSQIKFGSILALRLTISGTELVVFNHHFPVDDKARFLTASLLSDLQEKVLADLGFLTSKDQEKVTVAHMGDFNSFPDLKGVRQVTSILAQGFIDSAERAVWTHPENPVYGEFTEKAAFTFVGFPHDVDREAAKKVDFTKVKGHLDHIFLSKGSPLVKDSARVWNSDPKTVSYNYTHWNGGGKFSSVIFPSDHLPLSVMLNFSVPLTED